MKHVHSTSQSRSLYSEDRLRGSDLSLTCSSLSEDSVTIHDERPGADPDHGHLARNVWDHYTSGSDLGKSRPEREQKPMDDVKKEPVCKKEKEVSNVDSTKTVSGSIFVFIIAIHNQSCLGSQGDGGGKPAVPVPLPLPINRRLKKEGDTSFVKRVGSKAQKHKHLIIAGSLFLILCLVLYLVLLVWTIRAGSC